MSTLTDRFSTRRATIRTRTGKALDEYFQKTTSGNVFMYSVSLSYLLLSVYLVSAKPQYYWLLHNIVMFLLFPIQYLFFRKDGNHYFFFEFCYWVNYSGMIVTFAALSQWMFPTENPGIIASYLASLNSTVALRGFFLLATGPVMFATKLFGFAIFFHDLGEVCSCWMHFSPGVVAYTFRWHSEAIHATFPGLFKYDVSEPLTNWGIGDIYYVAIYYICVWAIPFYLMLWMLKDRLIEKGYKTLIHFVCEGDMLKSFSPKHRPIIYIVGHFIGSVIAMVISLSFWKFEVAHSAFLGFLFFSMIHSGGYQYYDVYFVNLRQQAVPKARQSMYDIGGGAAEMTKMKTK